MSIHPYLSYTINTVEGATHLAEIHWRRDNHPRHIPFRSLRDLLEASSEESSSEEDQSIDSFKWSRKFNRKKVKIYIY